MSCICNLAIFEAKAVPISRQHGNIDTCLVRMVILKPSNKSVAFAPLSDLRRRSLFSAKQVIQFPDFGRFGGVVAIL